MNQYEQLEELLLNKTYAALNVQERAFVMEYLSEVEYNDQRQLLQHHASTAFATVPLPPARLATNLQAAVIARKPQVRGQLHWLGVAAAALVGVFLLGRWTANSQVEYQEPTTITIVEEQRDTVYLERLVEKEIPTYIYRERLVLDTVYINTAVAAGVDPKVEGGDTLIVLNGSRNAKTTSRLLEMVVEVY